VIAAFAAIYLIWGSTYLAIRLAIETMPPLLMAGTRFTVAGLLLFAWARTRGGAPAPTRRQWGAAALMGVLLLACGNGGVSWSEQRVASGLAALLVALVPLWTVLLEWARPGGRRPAAAVLVGLALGLGGVALLVAPGSTGGRGVDPVGALVLLGATLAWSIGSVSARRLPLPSSPLMATALEMLAGGAALLVAGLAGGEGRALHLAAITPRSLLALGYLVVFGSLVAFTAFVWLLRVRPAGRVATYAFVNPAVAVLLGWAVLGEALAARTLVAAAVIVAGVALITTAQDRGARLERA
jgi:drug/metabolite transporter (DMT)-like permease